MKKIISGILSKVLPVSYEYTSLFIHHQAPEFFHLLKCDDKQEAFALFNQLSPSSRCLLVEAISDTVQQDDFFDDFFDKSNGPALACLLRGALLLKRAWIYRSYGRAADLTDDQVEKMHTALENSMQSFVPAMDDELLGQEACARSIRTLMGLSAEWEEIDYIYKQMKSFSGTHILGELNYLIASCEKWGGSHGKMFSHAEKTIKAAPERPELGALVAAAHWEMHMYIERFEQDEAKALAYRSNESVLNEVKTLSDRLLSASEHSGYDYIISHNIFAAFFCEANHFTLARPHFEFMKSKVILYPWEFFMEGDLQKMYNKALRSN